MRAVLLIISNRVHSSSGMHRTSLTGPHFLCPVQVLFCFSLFVKGFSTRLFYGQTNYQHSNYIEGAFWLWFIPLIFLT